MGDRSLRHTVHYAIGYPINNSKICKSNLVRSNLAKNTFLVTMYGVNQLISPFTDIHFLFCFVEWWWNVLIARFIFVGVNNFHLRKRCCRLTSSYGVVLMCLLGFCDR